MKATYVIQEVNYPDVEALVAKLNRKAVKLGLAPLTLTKDKTEDVEVIVPATDINGGYTKLVRTFTVTLDGADPVLPGWTFAATLHWVEGQLLILGTGTHEVPTRFRTAEPWCDHCQTKRWRKDTYLVVSDAGEWQQVGSNCLADFTGHQDPHAVARYAEALAGLVMRMDGFADEDSWGGGGGEPIAYRDLYMAYVAMDVRQRGGFLSRTKARAEGNAWDSTADVAWDAYWNLRHDAPKPSDIDIETATNIMEWADADVAALEAAQPDNDYIYNVRVSLGLSGIDRRTKGILASVYSLYFRSIAKVHTNSQHVGTVGKREDFTLTLENVRWFTNGFGDTCLMKFHDADDNTVVWWASNPPEWHEGETRVLKATVKDHGDFKGQAQTTLTRGKLVTK